MKVSGEAKKKQWRLSQLFTQNIAKKFRSALAKPSWQPAPSYYRPNTLLLHKSSKPTTYEVATTVL